MEKVLITGGSEGIGYAFAEYYARKGAYLFLCARDNTKLKHAKQKLEKQYVCSVEILSYDLSKEDDLACVKQLLEKKKPDVLINCAGSGTIGESWNIDEKKDMNLLKVNITALTVLTKAALSYMTKNYKGTVIEIASTGAFQPGPYIASYYASKSFVLSYAEAAALEAKPYGVQVSCICPGPVATKFYEKQGSAVTFGAMQADQVVQKAMRQVEKGKTVIIPGAMNCLVLCVPKRIRVLFLHRRKKQAVLLDNQTK